MAIKYSRHSISKGWVIIIFMTLAGCDTFYGPRLQNGYPHPIELQVQFEDSTYHNEIWPQCAVALIGQPKYSGSRLPLKKPEALTIENITIRKDGIILNTIVLGNHLNSSELNLEAQIVLVVDENGMHTENIQNQCKITP